MANQGNNLSQWDDLIRAKASQHGLPEALVRSVIYQESRGNPRAVSPVGAAGLMQLMPATAKDLGVTDPFDPVQNVDAGVRYLKQMVSKYGLVGGVAAYNAGPGNVEKYKGVPPFKETQGYVKDVLGRLGSWDAMTGGMRPPEAEAAPKSPYAQMMEPFANLRRSLGMPAERPKEEPKFNPLEKPPWFLQPTETPEGSFLDALYGAGRTAFKGANQASAKILDTGARALRDLTPFGLPNTMRDLTEAAGVPVRLDSYESKFADLTRRINPFNALANLTSRMNQEAQGEAPTQFEKRFNKPILQTPGGTTLIPSGGELVKSIGTYAPEMALAASMPGAGMGQGVVDRFGIQSPAVAKNIQAAVQQGFGGLAGGTAKGEPKEAAVNTALFPLMTMAGAGVGYYGKQGVNLAKRELPAVKRILQDQTGAVPNPLRKAPATVPESAETIGLQMEALQAGRTPAVLVTPGSPMPEIPRGFKATETEVGTWIHDPTKLKTFEIKRDVLRGDFGRHLGHLEPKSPETSQVVSAVQNGIEAKTSLASPGNELAQAQALQRQFPKANIGIGGPEAAPGVLRARNLSNAERQMFQQLRFEIEQASPGKRIFQEAGPGMGGDMVVSREASTFPIPNLGTKKEQLSVLNKFLAGKKLTANQRVTLDEMRSYIQAQRNVRGSPYAYINEQAQLGVTSGGADVMQFPPPAGAGGMPPREPPPPGPVMKERGFTKTVRDAQNTPSQVAAGVSGEYQPLQSQQSMAVAQKAVEIDPVKAREIVLNAKEYTPEIVRVGHELMRIHNAAGDYDMSIRIADKMAEMGTKHGQTIQAYADYARLGPEGILRLAQKTVRQAREDLPKAKIFQLRKEAEKLAEEAAAKEPAFSSTGPVPTKQSGLFPTPEVPEPQLTSTGPVPSKPQELFPTPEMPEPNLTSTGPVPTVQTDLGFKTSRNWEDFVEIAAKKLKLPSVSPEFAQKITETAAKIEQMPEGYERAFETAKMLKEIGSLVPSSKLRKIATFQTIAQLFNPKTWTRNLVGNAAFTAAENVKDVVAAPIDRAVSLFTGQRTKSLAGGNQYKEQMKGFMRGLYEGTREAWHGVDTSRVADKFSLNDIKRGMLQTPTFRGKLMGNIERVMGVALRAPDRAFYKAAVNKSLAEQMSAARVAAPTAEMFERAHFDGLYKTFQDDSAAARVFSSIKRGLNDKKEFGVGDILLKYPKTPGNILTRSIEYSPAGFVKSLMELGRAGLGLIGKGQGFDQKAFVDSTARALVGTGGLTYLGYGLSNIGILRNTAPTDPDLRAVEATEGRTQSQLNVTALKRYILSGFDKKSAEWKPEDNLVTYDWAVPLSTSLSLGARAQEKGMENSTKLGAQLDNLAVLAAGFEGSLETLGEQPMIKTLTSLARGQTLPKSLTNIAKGVPASFTPTLFKQLEQLTDNTRRDTFDPNPMVQAFNMVLGKTPKASDLPARIDPFGRKMENYQGGTNSPLNVLLNPAFMSKYRPTPESKMVVDLYRNTSDARVVPIVIENKYKWNGIPYEMNAKQKNNMQKWVGERTQKFFATLAVTPGFVDAPDQVKVKLLTEYLTNVRAAGRALIFLHEFNQQPLLQRPAWMVQTFQKNKLSPAQIQGVFRDIVMFKAFNQ